MAKSMDMTRGRPARLIVTFALPLMLGTIFQQLYSLVDSAVVGRLLGVDAFAAVGAASFFGWLSFSVVLGLSQGFGVLFAQRFGAKTGLKRAVSMALLLTLALGAALTALFQLAVHPVLLLVRTPDALLSGALAYLRWTLGGLVVTFLYNAAASLLRAVGDGRTPLVAVILSSVLNIVLDLLFVAALHLGISGVALATVLAQFFAFGYCLWKLRTYPDLLPALGDFRLEAGTLHELLRLGAPLAFRDAVISVGGLVVQSVINGYGVLFVAGTTAARRYFGLMEMAGGALEGALATFVGQNYGAGEGDRIRTGVRICVRIAVVCAVAVALLIVALGRPLLGLLVAPGEEAAQAIGVGYANLCAIALCLPALYLLYVYRSALQGIGRPFVPMLSGFAELLLRIAAVYLLPRWFGVWGVYFAEPAGWVGAGLLLCVSYYRCQKKMRF
ncbi:MATE family efflux transporter [Beduinella massiliensis]|uniref:MATE family efflux transporter n=1 Tax=Beduinella massiliensis TaxID=1852363 RepID=UPI000C81B6D5